MHSSRMCTVCCSGTVPGGRVLFAQGVSAQGGISGVCLGGCPVSAGGCLPRGVSARHIPIVNKITDRCKNITLPQLGCGQ